MLQHWIWFAQLQELNGMQKLVLLGHFSDPEGIYYGEPGDIPAEKTALRQMLGLIKSKDLTEAETILKTCEEKEIRILTYADREYPGSLRNIDEPPMVLYCRGQLPDYDGTPVIGVVGTRKATAYGLSTARHLSREIAACGALVVSGCAYGIDGMAMQGALEVGNPVTGVLGCGVDVVYPKSNRQLLSNVLEHGCLISEYPPGTPPLKWNFPRRNRIISGMSNGVLVVEAPEGSGALITARLAMEQGRDVFVVPGNINVKNCAGSNALLQAHAQAVCSGWDVVREYVSLYPGRLQMRTEVSEVLPATEEITAKVAQNPAVPRQEKPVNTKNVKKTIDNGEITPYSGINDAVSALSEEEQALVRCLSSAPRPVDEVIAEVGIPTARVLGMLTMLALKGFVVNHPGRCVSLKAK